jgi:hypothetical protein
MGIRSNKDLIGVLREAQGFLRRPNNDFVWSSWENAEEGLAEIEGYIRQVEEGDYSSELDMQVLFAPTGSLQELSISSGWGREFLDLAARFDRALGIEG